MINIENQNQGRPSLMNADFETVLTGLRELKDRNLPFGNPSGSDLLSGLREQKDEKILTMVVPTGAQLLDTWPRMSGTVKWFNPTKGFGFITPDNGGLDVFVHQSEIQLSGFRSLAQGEPVEYQLYDGQKGPKALKVTGPQGEQVKGAPRQAKPKVEKATLTDNTHVPSNLINLAGNFIQVANHNHVPVSTPVLAPTQALHALPSMISTPTPGSPQISHYFVAQPGLQHYYATASDLSSFDMSHRMPMSPTPLMIEGMPMSPQPQYIPFTPVGQYTTAHTPTPFSFPNQNQQNSMAMNVMNSPPQVPQQMYDYSYQMHMVPQDGSNPYGQSPHSFIDESAQRSMQISSPLSPIHIS